MEDETQPTLNNSSELKTQLNHGQNFMKWIIVGLSILYLIFGIVLVSVGAYAMNSTVSDLTGETLPEGVIAVGVFMIITSLAGVFSAIKEIRLGLGIYFVFMAIWTIILISVGIAIVAEKGNARNIVNDAWADLTPGQRTAIQKAGNCCGRNDPTDLAGPDCPGTTINDTTGCSPALINTFESNFNTVGSCGIAFAVIMLVGLVFTCWLMRGIKDNNINAQILKLRARTAKDIMNRRQRGKAGFKMPDNVL